MNLVRIGKAIEIYNIYMMIMTVSTKAIVKNFLEDWIVRNSLVSAPSFTCWKAAIWKWQLCCDVVPPLAIYGQPTIYWHATAHLWLKKGDLIWSRELPEFIPTASSPHLILIKWDYRKRHALIITGAVFKKLSNLKVFVVHNLRSSVYWRVWSKRGKLSGLASKGHPTTDEEDRALLLRLTDILEPWTSYVLGPWAFKAFTAPANFT